MSNLQYRQEKIQSKRKQTPWRDFVMEICSWMPINFYKWGGYISRYPYTNRITTIVDSSNIDNYENILNNKTYEQEDFFNSYFQLRKKLPHPNINYFGENENVSFADQVHNSKNVYLSNTVTFGSENILYSIICKHNCKNVINSVDVVDESENIYNSKHIIRSLNIYFSECIEGSNNIWYSYNMIGCIECIGCYDLTNQSYCIENILYSKDEYYQRKERYLSQNKYRNMPSVTYKNRETYNSTGQDLNNCDNVHNAFHVYNVHNGQNILYCGSQDTCHEVYDAVQCGRLNHVYGFCGGGAYTDHAYCGSNIVNCNNIYYCNYMTSCSFCLGCIGLKNKSYCILNKQYTKEERYAKVDEIFTQMEQDGQLGEFFPASMNPFYFNDTAAYLIDNSFTKEEVIEKGYLRRDEPIKVDIPEGAKVVKTSELDQYEGRKDASSGTIVKDLTILSGDASTNSAGQKMEGQSRWIDPEILNVIIQDEQGNVYKIVKMEYDFLMKYGLPLPRKHWLDRMKENFRIQ